MNTHNIGPKYLFFASKECIPYACTCVTVCNVILNVQVDVLGNVAKLVSERDNALRQAVLGTMEALYCCEGDGERTAVMGTIRSYIGSLQEVQSSIKHK